MGLGSEIYPKHGIEGFYLNEPLSRFDATIVKWVVPHKRTKPILLRFQLHFQNINSFSEVLVSAINSLIFQNL
jgi:hypothetical protein